MKNKTGLLITFGSKKKKSKNGRIGLLMFNMYKMKEEKQGQVGLTGGGSTWKVTKSIKSPPMSAGGGGHKNM